VRRRSLTGLQERFEASELGRAVISGLVVVILVVIVAANLPASELQRQVTRIAEPVIRAVGINQVWSVFAPEPRSIVVYLEALVDYDDGTTGVWRPPDGPPFPDSYRDVRWIRLVQSVTDPATQGLLAPILTNWLRRELTTEKRAPVRITLVERRYRLLEPEKTPSRTPTRTRPLFTLDLEDGP
jgi:hypothetical protein